MGVTDGHGQGVGRILRGGRVQGQQGAHHGLHLALFGLAVAGHALFDPPGGVVDNRESAVLGGDHGRTPRMAEFEGRTRVAADENVLDRGHFGLMRLDHLAQVPEDGQQTPGEIGLPAGADGAAGDEAEFVTAGGDHAVARDPRARIDPEDAHG